MKKNIVSLLAVLFVLLTASIAAAQNNRDVLLTADGTLYTVETVSGESGNGGPGLPLWLTIQNGTVTTSMPVPASLTNSMNVEPALAYDSASGTLFLFWNAMRNNGLSSDLMFCSYRNGIFGPARALDGADWNMRSGLHIGITRQTEIAGTNGTTVIAEITVHAVWWQDNGAGEWARYAMLTTESGTVTSVDVRDLTSFTGETLAPSRCNSELLRHPVVLESTTPTTVEVAFGDANTNKLHRVTLKPVANGRLRIPIGVREEAIPTPIAVVDANASLSAMSSGNDGLVLYFTNAQTLKYVLFKNGAWSPMRSIALSDRLTREGAVGALRRMVSSE
jgi:hypothetical protein